MLGQQWAKYTTRRRCWPGAGFMVGHCGANIDPAKGRRPIFTRVNFFEDYVK